MTRAVAFLLASALSANCAATTASRAKAEFTGDYVASAPKRQDPPGVTAAYVKALPPGARISLRLTDGRTMKGTLMVVQEDAIVVRPRTRVPEPAQTIPLANVATIETERESGGMGRAIAIGAAVGAGAAIGVFLALLAAFAD
jgi:hypothetical protein